MRIACLNIHAGRCGTGKNRPSLPEIAELLRSVLPDICLLQEVDRRMPRSRFVDQAGQLARAMRRDGENEWYFAFYGRLNFGPLGQYGNAILCRAPFQEVKRLPLPASGGEPRAALRVRFQQFAIWTVHLGLREEWRESQLVTLANAIREDISQGYLILLGGDFNTIGESTELQQFLERTELVAVSSANPTFPASEPTHRIDYLFASPELATIHHSGTVANSEATDHCLLWTEIIRS